ncbi:DUF3710 domain-containing protein [Stackebrandtia albiflava]|uniref:DUF3710 domain-containing protein n=1 Tax=Stackebrandtia albiflava TaxID=406432 RepID=UPI0031F0F87D
MFGRRRRRGDKTEIDADVTGDSGETGADAADVTRGPYDSADAPDDEVRRLDLGSMRVPTPPGVEARMQTDDKGNVRQVTLIHGESAVQIGVFAAPRTEEIWDEVREEIAGSVAKQGGRTEEIDGDYGVELLVRSSGQQGDTAARFVGIDGPRWFVRAVFQGRMATDPTASDLLDDCVRGVVVERGNQAMPVLEGLPLKLPAGMAEQAKAKLAANRATASTTATGTGGINGAAPEKRPSPRPKKR